MGTVNWDQGGAPGWATAPPPPPGPHPRRRRGGVLAPAAAALLLGILVGVPVGALTRASQSGPSNGTHHSPGAIDARARTLYQQALMATRSSPGFHYVAVSSAPSGTQTIVGDAGRADGRQVITLDSAFGSEHFTLVLESGTVYFQGNSPALEDQLGVPLANLSSVQGRWVAVSGGDGPYTILAAGITVSDQAQEIALVPTSTLQIRAPGGVRATRILGSASQQQGALGGAAHLDVVAGSDLPISEVSTITVGGVTLASTTTFSGWGRALHAAAPASPTAWSTLGASPPVGGYGGGDSGTPGPSSTPHL